MSELRWYFSLDEMPIHVNCRLQSKPPIFIDWASNDLYSNVESSMTSITGNAMTVRFSETRDSSGSSHPAIIQQQVGAYLVLHTCGHTHPRVRELPCQPVQCCTSLSHYVGHQHSAACYEHCRTCCQ